MTTKTLIVRGQDVTIFHYEFFLELYKDWRNKGMSQEDIEDIILG